MRQALTSIYRLLVLGVERKMQTKEKQEQRIKWFVLPNESYKWDFILDKQMVENPQLEASGKAEGIKVLCDEIDVLPINMGTCFLARSRPWYR
jgi:hypothetical protein